MPESPAPQSSTALEIGDLARRIEELEAQVASLAHKLSGATPQENAKKIRILSKIIEGLAQTIRRIARQIEVLRQLRESSKHP